MLAILTSDSGILLPLGSHIFNMVMAYSHNLFLMGQSIMKWGIVSERLHHLQLADGIVWAENRKKLGNFSEPKKKETTGIEPVTCRSAVGCSTAELHLRFLQILNHVFLKSGRHYVATYFPLHKAVHIYERG